MKLNFQSHINESNYNFAGWPWVLNVIHKEFYNPNGVHFEPHIEWPLIHQQGISLSWVGFSHSGVHNIPESNGLNLESLFGGIGWERMAENCLGIFTFERHTAGYLKKIISSPVQNLILPTPKPNSLFDINNYNKRLAIVGMKLRDWHVFHLVKSNFLKKILLKCISNRYYPTFINSPIIETLSGEAYDKFLCSNVVFLPLCDSTSSSVLTECIVRNTPVLTDDLPANVEYLGRDYPLLYHSIQEAEDKINNPKTIIAAHDYLVSMDKRKFTIEYFIDSIKECDFFGN